MRLLIKKVVISLFISLAIGAFFSLLFWQGFLYSWQLKLADNFYVGSPNSGKVSIVGIDAKTLDNLGRWPFDRIYHTQVLKNLEKAGARVIGIDILFSEPSSTEGDKALAEAIKASPNVIQPILIEFPKSQIASGLLKAEKFTTPIDQLIESYKEAPINQSLGHVNILPDSDNVTRRIPLAVKIGDSFIPSFGLKILASYNVDYNKPAFLEKEKAFRLLDAAGSPLPDIPVDKSGRMLINYVGGPGSFPYLSFFDVYENKFDPALVKDKIVLIGITDPAIPDSQATPLSQGQAMFGVEIHANIINTILTANYIRNQNPVQTLYLILLISFLLGLLVPLFKPLISSAITLTSIIVYIISAAVIFEYKGIILNLVWPPLVIVFVFIGITLYRFMAEEKKARELKNAFGKYVSRDVLAQILAHPEKLVLGGAKKEMTVLFSDIRGFTSISEKMKPDELVSFLNTYLDAMTRQILENKGVLDKYIGDAIMAFWNGPVNQKNHAELACQAAFTMVAALDAFNSKQRNPINIGIGINTGEMVVGNMGSAIRFDYTVIGDAVNLSSRLEGTNKEYGTRVIIAEATYNYIKEKFTCRELDLIRVKGKNEPVRIYELVADNLFFQAQNPYLAEFHQGLSLYRAGDFNDADAKFNHVLEMKPDDGPSLLMRSRCEQYQKTPPPADWGGVYDRRTK